MLRRAARWKLFVLGAALALAAPLQMRAANACWYELSDPPIEHCDHRDFDPNGDGVVDPADVIYLVNYLYENGPAPVGSGDANGDGVVDFADIAYLIAYLYEGGPPPV